LGFGVSSLVSFAVVNYNPLVPRIFTITLWLFLLTVLGVYHFSTAEGFAKPLFTRGRFGRVLLNTEEVSLRHARPLLLSLRGGGTASRALFNAHRQQVAMSSSSASTASDSQKRVTAAGWSQCGAFKQAKEALTGLQVLFPKDFHVTIKECQCCHQ
jgi:hypothetical protein